MARIIVDLDGITAAFMEELLSRFNERYKEDLKISSITGWDVVDGVSWEALGLKNIYEEPCFFASLNPIPGAIRSLKYLQDVGHEIIIASAPCTPLSASEKLEWCQRWLSFIPRSNIVITKGKHFLRGDFLIDDSTDNAHLFLVENPDAKVLTIAYPYNNSQIFALRADDADTVKAWSRIVAFIEGTF